MIWKDIQSIRREAPLIHNITNYVVMNSTANALLAIGASPVMSHAREEVEEMVDLARALVINLGTLSPPWVEAMIMAGLAAQRRQIPVVFDPVGCGATKFRTTTAQRIAEEIHPSIIRGNASEIRSLVHSGAGTKGVDSVCSVEEMILEDAQMLSLSHRCVVSVSGEFDLIVGGKSVSRIANGHPMMSLVTGMGCAATAIIGAFASVNPLPFQAATHAMAVMGVIGEMAAERSIGPGTFWPNFLDLLYLFNESDLRKRIKMQVL